MKKTIFLLALCAVFAFNNVKLYRVEQPGEDWVVYLRNIDRLQAMAGRNVPNSELVLATKDTVTFFQARFLRSIGSQLKDTSKTK
jgi:hypothetical protein